MADETPKKAGKLVRKIGLKFESHDAFEHVGDPIHEDLSASARIGDSLFLSCDETAGVDRLTPEKRALWANHGHYNLGDHFKLPDGRKGEMDIEGMAIDGTLLWVVGSHSLKRDKPDDDDSPVAALKAMEDIDRDPNRYFLGYVPLKETEPGEWEPVKKANGVKPRALKLKKKSSVLLNWLQDDEILAPFLNLPSKENGIDIEGLAVSGMRVWLGLRGPAIRGHAVILEMQMKVTKKGHLKATKIDGKRRYRKYLIASAGLGIRDLLLDGEDMLILLGPTMSSDGPARVLRWRRAARDTQSSMIRGDRLSVACDLPYLGQYDHPEGLALWPEDGEKRFLVVYDSPAPKRLEPAEHKTIADIMAFDE